MLREGRSIGHTVITVNREFFFRIRLRRLNGWPVDRARPSLLAAGRKCPRLRPIHSRDCHSRKPSFQRRAEPPRSELATCRSGAKWAKSVCSMQPAERPRRVAKKRGNRCTICLRRAGNEFYDRMEGTVATSISGKSRPMKPNLRLTLLVLGCAAGLVVATSQVARAQCCGTYSSYYVPYVSWYVPTTAYYGGCGCGCSTCGTCGSCGRCGGCSSCSGGCGSSCGSCSSCGSGCATCGYRSCGSCCTSYYYPAYYWPWFGAKPSTTRQLAKSTAPTTRLRSASTATARRVAASPKRTAASPTRVAAVPKAAPIATNVVQAEATLPQRSEQGPQLLLISQDSSDRSARAIEWKPLVPPEAAPLRSLIGTRTTEKNVLRTSGESQMVY